MFETVDFKLLIFTYLNVGNLNVTVNDTLFVQVKKCFGKMLGESSDFNNMKSGSIP